MINPRPKANHSQQKRRDPKKSASHSYSQKRVRGNDRTQSKPSPPGNGRLVTVWAVLLLGMLGLGWRLYQLQVVQAEELQKRAKQQQTFRIKPYVPRRPIIDSDHNVLATDRLVYTFYVHPKLFDRPKEEVAQKLAPILNTTSQNLLAQFNKRETGVQLAKGVTESQAAEIKGLKNPDGIPLAGLQLDEEYTRYYPQDEMVADVIGYVDRSQHQGQAGIESSQKQLLEREALSLNTRRMGDGRILPAFVPEGLFQADDLQLQLTLDLQLQRAARLALKEQLKKFNAKRGAVLVMDAHDGSMLAMVCEPTFNPNQYYKHNVSLFKNWTVSDLYEPGSTFKPLNIALALDSKAINTNSIFYDSGSIAVDRWTIKNASRSGNGSMTLARILQTSSNIGMVQIIQKMKRQDYYDRLLGISLNQKTGVDLPGEATGHMKPEKQFLLGAIESATAAFGQGFSLTPLKLIQLHGALANGGTLVTPHLVRGLADGQGRLHWQPAYPKKAVFSPEAAKEVLMMMETVVTEGTGEAAQIPGYRIGGKTGTAQKASARGGYLANAKITSFVSILPVESPRYVVLVVVDEPKGGNTFGSTVAAPVAKLVMQALISLKGLPPATTPKPTPSPTATTSPRHD
ncbi:MAG: Stage V sporulation protein D [Chroococcopsis gigantea SAG 12.99]|jgi:cell division protein FtsI (penicillin-binding protein 3)|nr:penicillin-binding protein 2 [Chlorogloea purpurea SAG 13.99]MDV2999454.1 Stage V sporulation protein D [Chroococcopsis gigantea SAG 12.99]